MRILMLNNEFPPLGGGTGVVNYHLFKQFADLDDLHIDLVTSSRSRSQYETEQFSENIRIYKVPVDNHNIHHSTNPELLRYSWRGYRFCTNLAKQKPFDLSFAFAGVPAGAISYLLNLQFGLPYIVSLQGPDVPGFEARYNYLYPFLKPVLRVIWRNASVVTAISEEHRRLAHETLPDLDIPLIYNGIDMGAFYPALPRKGSLKILCVGRLIQRKGQQHLLRAFSGLCRDLNENKMSLVLAGTGDGEAALIKLVKELGISDRVQFRGFVPKEEMPQIYRDADIFVLPSQNEGMSIALLEAMASALPVIVTNTGGTDELVVAGKNGYIVEWADVEGITRKLRKLILDHELRIEMGRKNQAIVSTFSWPNIAQQTIDIMNSILERQFGKVKPEINPVVVEKTELH